MKQRSLVLGFTLIEMVVAVGMIAGVITMISAIIINSFVSGNKVNYSSRVEETGKNALTEIRANLLKADAGRLGCPSMGIGSSITVVNREDDRNTTLVCVEDNYIASVSAELGTVKLTGSQVRASGCGNFVKLCDSSLSFPAVEISFTLSSGQVDPGSKNYFSRSFEDKIVIRE